MRTRFCFLLALLLLAMLLPGERAWAQATYYDRHEVPGHYTLGLYGDERGATSEITLESGESHFEAFIGMTGDSTKIFSGAVFRLELPEGVRRDGPIRWNTIEGLTARGKIDDLGLEVEFNKPCQGMRGPYPVIIGRIPLELEPGVHEVTIALAGHKRFGLSVELCDPNRAWPKPFAQPHPVTVRRELGFWERLTSWFD